MRTTPNLPDGAVSAAIAARWLHVDSAWLRAEVEAGRLPGVKAGRTVLVHCPTVARLLAERAKQAPATGGEGGSQ